jgi:hypothetical protein
MPPERELDVVVLAQDVVDAWGMAMLGGKGAALSRDFKALFDKACAYRTAKEVADNHRAHNMLTQQEEEREHRTRKEFLNAYLPVVEIALKWCSERV